MNDDRLYRRLALGCLFLVAYVALDYGHSGGGHGHPDRLNLLLVDGATRWLDDPEWLVQTLAGFSP